MSREDVAAAAAARVRRAMRIERKRFTTVNLVRTERVPLIVLPTDDLNKLGHEARDATLENGRVTANDVLVVDLRLIILMYHCNAIKCL